MDSKTSQKFNSRRLIILLFSLVVCLLALSLLLQQVAARYPRAAQGFTPPLDLRPTASPLAQVALPGTPVPQAVQAISPENAHQVVELARWGKGALFAMAWSPDGDLLGLASANGVFLYEADSMREVRYILPNTFTVSLAFSPDGQLVAAGSNYGEIYLIRVSDGQPVRTLNISDRRSVHSLAFSPDGQFLASVSYRDIRLWAVQDGALLYTLNLRTQQILRVVFSPDGQTLAAALGTTDNVHFWRASDGAELPLPQDDGSRSLDLAFSPNGQWLALQNNADLLLWSLAEPGDTRVIGQPHSSLSRLAFLPNGKTLVSLEERGICLWRVSDGELLQVIETGPEAPEEMAVSPDGKRLATYTSAGVIQQWKLPAGEPYSRSESGHWAGYDYLSVTSPVASSEPGAGPVWLAAGALDVPAQVWSLDTAKPLRTLPMPSGGSLSGLAFAPGSRLLAQSGAGVVDVWDVPDGVILRSLATGEEDAAEAEEAPYEPSFSPDGRLVALGAPDGRVYIWQVSNGSLRHSLQFEGDPTWRYWGPRQVVFSPDGRLVVSDGERHGQLAVWDLAYNGQLLTTLDGYAGLAFAPDGHLLAAVEPAGRLGLWQVSNWKPRPRLGGNLGGAENPVFSPDGRLLAASSWYFGIALWRVSDGALLRMLPVPRADADLAFSADGRWLISASTDGTIRIWGVLADAP